MLKDCGNVYDFFQKLENVSAGSGKQRGDSMAASIVSAAESAELHGKMKIQGMRYGWMDLLYRKQRQ